MAGSVTHGLEEGAFVAERLTDFDLTFDDEAVAVEHDPGAERGGAFQAVDPAGTVDVGELGVEPVVYVAVTGEQPAALGLEQAHMVWGAYAMTAQECTAPH